MSSVQCDAVSGYVQPFTMIVPPRQTETASGFPKVAGATEDAGSSPRGGELRHRARVDSPRAGRDNPSC